MELQSILDRVREKRTAALAKAEEITVKAATETRDLTEDEAKQYAVAIADSDKLGVEEARLVKLIAEKAAMAQPAGRRSVPETRPSDRAGGPQGRPADRLARDAKGIPRC